MKLFLVGFLFIILSIVFFIYYPIHRAQNKRRKASAEGIITKVDVTMKKDEHGGILEYNYTYKYDITFNTGSKDITIRSGPVAFHKEEGDKVTVKYNPDKPEDAHIDDFHGSSSSSKIILYFALGCLVVGILCFIIGFNTL